jgi:hypothetical protein
MGRVSSVGIAIAASWTIRRSNPAEEEISSTRPHRPWGPPSFPYNGCRVCFPGVKRPGCGVNNPTQSNAEVKERVALYLYSRSGPSWSVAGWTLLGIMYTFLLLCLCNSYIWSSHKICLLNPVPTFTSCLPEIPVSFFSITQSQVKLPLYIWGSGSTYSGRLNAPVVLPLGKAPPVTQ